MTALATSAATAATAARPNFILILTDDQDLQLGGLDDMPHTRKALMDGGMTFGSGYTVNPICCPSRTALISGRYPHNLEEEIPAVGWCGDFTGHPLENHTFISALHDAGYMTSLSGKYHNEPPVHYTPNGCVF